jgi:hypothetical protein
MFRASREHLAEVGETYFEHMQFALVVGALTIGAGLACTLHAIVPALCPRTCSRTVGLLQRLFADRRRLPSVIAQSSALLLFVMLMAVSSVTGLVVGFCTFGNPVGLVVIPQAFALPIIFLWQNPQLESVPVRA